MSLNKALLIHAEKFGIEGVAATAVVDLHYDVNELAELLDELDVIHERQLNDKKERSKLGLKGIAPKHRLTSAERAEKLIAELRPK